MSVQSEQGKPAQIPRRMGLIRSGTVDEGVSLVAHAMDGNLIAVLLKKRVSSYNVFGGKGLCVLWNIADNC